MQFSKQTAMVPKSQMAQMLSESALFAGLSPESLMPLAALFEATTYEAQTIVLHEGLYGDDLYFIAKGRLDVYLKERPEFPVATLDPCACVGEMTLLNDNDPRTATVIASERSLILRVRKSSIVSAMDTNPIFAAMVYRNIAKMLGERLALSNSRFRETSAE